MINRLKQLIRWAKVTMSGADDKQFPVQQVTYMGKVGDCMMIFPYGMHGNASKDSLVAMFEMGADSANRAGIPGTPQDRPQMAADEFCLYHPKTQSIIHFRSDSGNIDIDVVKNKSGNININANQANITASDSVNVNTDVVSVVAATSVTIDSPDSIFTGDVQIDGALNVDGDITSLANIIASLLVQGATLNISGAGTIDGQDYTTHNHSQGNDGNGDSQQNTSGVL